MTTRPDAANRILAAALDAFAGGGYPAASLNDIATAAECTKANVLYHFGSKKGVLDAALGPAIAAVAALRDGVLGHASDADPYLELIDLVLDYPREAQLLLFHHETLPDPQLGMMIVDLFDDIAQTVAPDDDRASARFTVAVIGLVHLLLTRLHDDACDLRSPFVELTSSREAAAQLLREMTAPAARPAAPAVLSASGRPAPAPATASTASIS